MPPKKKQISEKRRLEKKWEQVQIKAFTKWINGHLSKKGLEMGSLADFTDGIMLVRLLEVLSDETDWSKKLMKTPKFKIHKVQNINLALDFIKSRNVQLHSIGAEDILDGNLKLTLGLIWMLILRFEIASISVEELTAKEALLLWCQKKTAGYNNVKVTNFTFSFQDGLAFCAIIHKHRPNMLNFDSLSAKNKEENLELAFKVADEMLGIPRFLDAEDMVEVKPDERSVMTYVSQFFHKFSGEQKYEVAGRRISNLVALTQGNDELKNEYIKKATALKEFIVAKTEELGTLDLDNTLECVKALVEELRNYIKNEKPGKAAEKTDVESLFNNIQVKLRNANRSAFVPPEGLAPADIDGIFATLVAEEQKRKKVLDEELKRLEKIRQLLSRFFLRSEKLQEWAGIKKEYLEKREVIDTINTAQANLKLLDSHDAQYDSSIARVDGLKDLGKEIVDLNYKNPEEVTSKTEEIDGHWARLKELSEEKRVWLEEELKKQNYMDELRKKFAQMASDTSRWHKDSVEQLDDTVFPETLEEVQQYEEKINEKETDLKAQSEEKKKALDDLKAEMDEAGIVDNRYTEITLDDISNDADGLNEAVEKLRKRYAEELKRQEDMEAKRKEFAAAVEDIEAHLKARRETIDALTGEPDELTDAIVGEYAEGAPEKEKMDNLQSIDKEAIEMLIVENKYTEENMLTVQSKIDDFDLYVTAYKNALAAEKNMKEDYLERVEKLFAWIAEQIPKLEVHEYDNTLDGINTVLAEADVYKSVIKPPAEGDKAAVWQLHSLIESYLKADVHNRPEFAPIEGQTLQEIDSEWQKLTECEKSRDEWMKTESERQEKLDEMQKKFRELAAKIENFCAKKKEFLESEAKIDSLTEANISVALLENFKSEYEAYSSFNTFKELGEELVAGNYHEAESITAKIEEVKELFEGLQPLCDTKSDLLTSELEEEKKKEDLRIKFADLAKDCEKWIDATKNKVDRYIFGDDLETVKAYAEKMEAEEAELLGDYNQKKEECNAAWSEMETAGVKENVHTNIVQEDILGYEGTLNERFQLRREEYEKELAAQELKEAKRIEFAESAQKLVDIVEESKSKLSAIEGEPEEKESAVKELYAEGAEFKEKLGDCLRIDGEAKELKIVDNKHTPYNARNLENKVAGHEAFYQNLLNFIDEEKIMKERALKTAEEWAAKEAIEAKRSEFSSGYNKVFEWLDKVDEVFRQEIEAESVADIEELIANYDEFVGEKPEIEELFSSLGTINGELSEAGETTEFDVVTGKWEEVAVALIEKRKTDLDEQLEVQKKNEELRVEFANIANELSEWIEGFTAKFSSDPEGDLEDQLKDAEVQVKEIEDGDTKLEAVEAADSKLVEAEVRNNPHTEHSFESLKASYEQIKKSGHERKDLIEKQILIKKGSEVSAEDLAEFQEMFKMFDKDNSNQLQWYEFKAALASLGEDLEEDEIKGIIEEIDKDGDGEISFEEFTEFMIKRRSDTDTSEQINEAFADLANGKAYVTIDDMKTVMEEKDVQYLTENMPLYEGEEGKYDFTKWTDSAFST